MSFFEPVGDGAFLPLPDAASRWDETSIRGPAITALLARAIERAVPEGPRLIPTRSTFDLHSRVPFVPLRTTARVVRRGRSLTIIEAEVYAAPGGTGPEEDAPPERDRRVLARGRASLLTPGAARAPAAAHGDAAPPTQPAVSWVTPLPAGAVAPDPSLRERSENGRLSRLASTQWTASAAVHREPEPGLLWLFNAALITGEAVSTYQLAAAVADLSNLGINADSEGLSLINTDVTLSLSRLPGGGGVGAATTHRSECDGISVGSAVLFDAAGACGLSTVSALRHEHRSVIPG